VRPGALTLAFVGQEAAGWEEQLVARLRTGELAALGEAYDAHHAQVRAFARRLVGDDAAAEDLLQETFLTLPRVVTRFRGESSLRSFLLGIAVRHANHYVRAASRRRAATDQAAREPRASCSTPDDDAQRAQLAQVLLRALDTLPVDQRVAVVLCEVEGFTSAEAGAIVGAPEGTVRTRLMHAKHKLRAVLGAEGVR
jgi:RNA polymerase sigma-70 factor, ECF subfamily